MEMSKIIGLVNCTNDTDTSKASKNRRASYPSDFMLFPLLMNIKEQ